MKSRQYLLMILDGVGINEDAKGNAYYHAKTPNLDSLFENYPNCRIKTSGLAVGLPEGQMGNSEVGHANIGSGRIVYQELTRISKSIKDGEIAANSTLLESFDNARQSGKSLHLIGLVSDGGVHSHQDHLYELIRLAVKNDVKNVFIHAFLDGRDTGYNKAADCIAKLESQIKQIGLGKIATIGGRYYGMDRDNRWERIELAYRAMVEGVGPKNKSAIDAINESYDNEVYDEFILPTVIAGQGESPAVISDGDSIIFLNYRPDRIRQIARVFSDSDFNKFNCITKPRDLHISTMTEYDSNIQNVNAIFKPQQMINTFSEYISKKGYTQVRIAETEKYAHVTFFFNGGDEKPHLNEDRILIDSPKVATYDKAPRMSAAEITEKVLESIDSNKYDIVIVNFANGDMVGHTGNFERTVEAVEFLDDCVGRIVESLRKVGGEAIITADHGNCEYMVDLKNGDVVTSHSTFDVPAIIISDRVTKVRDGRLCDIAPTMLRMMDEEIPIEMSGDSLVELIKKEEI